MWYQFGFPSVFIFTYPFLRATALAVARYCITIEYYHHTRQKRLIFNILASYISQLITLRKGRVFLFSLPTSITRLINCKMLRRTQLLNETKKKNKRQMMGNPVPSKLCLVTRTTWLAISTRVLRFPRSRECLSKRILASQIAYYVIHRIVIHIFHVCILPFRYNAENFDIKFNQWIST